MVLEDRKEEMAIKTTSASKPQTLSIPKPILALPPQPVIKTITPPVVRSGEGGKTLFKLDLKPSVAEIPDFDDITTIDVRYPLIPPYAYVHIFWDPKSDELIYDVEEPQLSDSERKLFSIVEEGVKELINVSFIGVKSIDLVIEYLEKNIKVLLDEMDIKVSDESFIKIMYYIYRNFIGLNEIEPLMSDYYIEDIECNGSKSPLYIVHRKFRNIRTNIIYENDRILGGFVEKLAQKCGKYISYANPLLDGRLPDKSRVNATYTQDISSKGPTFTIRKFTSEPWTPVHLMAFKTASSELMAYLWLLIEYERNIMIIGGTGSGKTSLLNALAFFIPPQARIVSIEDTAELNLVHENWLPSIARAGFGIATITGEKHGEVTLFDLLKESFRQRPDYVIVGEIRGKEANVLFQGAASGHPTISTMHAENVDSMIKRLETAPISLSASLVESLDITISIAQTKVGGKAVRRVREISEILRVGEDGRADINIPFRWDPRRDVHVFSASSKIFNKLIQQQGINPSVLSREFKARTMLLNELFRRQIFDYKQVQETISQYYKTPEKVLRKLNIHV